MLSKFLVSLYVFNNRILRKIIKIIITKLEGGEIYSKTLRKIYSEYHSINVGMYSYGGCFTLGNIPEGTNIGNYGSFGDFIVFQRNHPTKFVSTHPFFFNKRFGLVCEDKVPSTKLCIGHNVWIGDNALVMPSVSQIGNGAVIGAGTVVTKNVPAYAVVVGNPGRVVKYRFSDDEINIIEQSKWWEKDIYQLKDNIEVFSHKFDKNSFFKSILFYK